MMHKGHPHLSTRVSHVYLFFFIYHNHVHGMSVVYNHNYRYGGAENRTITARYYNK